MKYFLATLLTILCLGASSQTITIVSPNGGEMLGGCSNVNISWVETGTNNTYDIDYSPNNGVTWVSVATAISTTNGFYSWQVPNISSGTFKVRVTTFDASTGAISVTDESDAVFTVNGALTLNHPTGGETTVTGATFPITFSANGTSNNYLFQYSINDGLTWGTIASNANVTSGSYNWTVPNVNTTEALVRMTDVSNSCITDQSDSTFSIVSEIDLTQPDGGETWQAQMQPMSGGVDQDVLVNTTDTTYVYAGRLLEHGGHGNYSGAVSYTRTLMPALPGQPVQLDFDVFNLRSGHSLKIYSGPGTTTGLLGTWTNTSSPGTVISSHVTGALTVQWTTNSTQGNVGFRADISIPSANTVAYQEIKWNRSGTSGNFNIEYSENNGAGWERIVSNYSNTNGTYQWHVPNVPTAQALVRVVDAGNSAVVDQSVATFTITQADPKLHGPNGGEKLLAGLTHTIWWDAGLFAGTGVVLEYSTDNGSTWTTIHSGTSNDGSYNWIVPNLSSTQALIRVSEYGNTSFNDVSDATFQISSYIEVTAPNGGQSFNGCNNATISWCAGATSGQYKLEYSDDNGSTWNTIVSSYSASGTTASYSWSVPNISSSNVLVRVSDAADGSKTDEGDATITIASTQYVDITSPAVNALSIAGSSLPIIWSSSGPAGNMNLYYRQVNSGWSLIANNQSGNSYAWGVPNLDSDSIYVRVSSATNNCIVDEVGPIEIRSEITVTSANGGESWKAEVPLASNGSSDVRISDGSVASVYDGMRFYDPGGTSNYTLPNGGSHTMTLNPAVSGAKVKLTFTAFDMAYFYNSSYNNAYHYIKVYNGPSTSSTLLGTYYSTNNPGTITSTHSSGALTVYMYETGYSSGSDVGWAANVSLIGGNANTEQITWNTTGTSGTYDVSYSVNNGSSWKEITNSYTTNLGTYDWLVPNDPTTQALIRVEDAGNSSIVDESDAVFTIEQADPRLEEPNGGEHFSAGTTTTIEWDPGYFKATVVVLEYSTDSGSTWNTITTGTTNDGSHIWTIPNDPSSLALVRASEYGNTSVNDVSDAVFTLHDYVELIYPTGGQTLNGCQSLTISWRAGATSDSYKLEYSTDGGSTWTTINGSFASTSATPSYNWNLPNSTSSNFRVRVSDANNSAKTDSSTDMTLGQSQFLTLTEPSGGELLIAGSSFQIDYLTSGTVSNVALHYNTNNGVGGWSTITSSTSGGSYNWTVPNVDADSVVVRARDASNSCITTVSPAFELRSEIAVTSANGGESWKAEVPLPTLGSSDIRISDGSVASVYDGMRFYDPGGASNYTLANGASHTMTLNPAVDGAKVKLSFTTLDMAYFYNSSYNNAYHYIKIYNGPSTSSPLLGTYYSTNNPGTHISTHSTGALTVYMYETGYSSGSDVGWVADVSLIGGNANTEQITWNTTGTSGTYDLSYSVNNGSSWKEIINSYTTNLGTYDWLVPNDPTTQALIRVEDAGNSSIVDESDAVFTIEQADPRLEEPNGGEHFSAGTTTTIEWDPGYFKATVVVLEYSTDSGSTWNTITTGTNNDGSHLWTIPNDPSSVAMVRASEYGNTSINDVSDAVFTLHDYVELIYPTGGQTLNGCQSLTISWRAGATSDSYKLEYSTDGGSTWTTINGSFASTSATPSYNWNLPNSTSSNLRVRVSDANNSAKMDTSTDMTLGQSQYLTLTEPSGGELLIAGSSFQIDYLTSGSVSNVALHYNTNNGVGGWSTITGSTSGGSYNWTVPNVDADSVVVRARDASNSCITTVSPAFEIRSEITVTSANGGESWKAEVPLPTLGSSDIRISDGSVASVYDGMRFYDPGGASNYTLANGASHTMTLNPAVDGAKVKLSFTTLDMAYFYNSSYNNAYHYIKIYNGPSTSSPLLGTYYSTNNPGTHISTHSTGALTVYMYETGYSSGSDVGWVADVSLIGGNANTEQITWNTTGTSGTYDLSYSVNNGSSWKEIINSYTTNLGTYDWLVPNDPTTQALIRVEDAGNSSIVDESDAVFTIEQADPRLEEPNGGEHFSAGTTTTIEWDPGYFKATVVVLEYSTDSGSTWNTITTGTNNDGSHLWTIPNDPSTVAMVRASEYGNTSINDVSDAVFTLHDYVDLIYPTGGQSFNGCQSLTISWRAGATSDSYKIEYSTDGGSTWTTINGSFASTSATPSYNWNLPNSTSSNFRVRVSDANNSTKTDSSTDMTLGQSQFLTLTEPSGGELLIAGSSFQIDYLTSGSVSNVALHYNTNNGVGGWSTITSSTSGGSYNWTVPNVDADSVVVRARDASNSCITTVSPSFEIRSEITVTSANGGESWKAEVPLPTLGSSDIRISDGSVASVYDGMRFYDPGGASNYTLANGASHTMTLNPAVDGAKVKLSFTTLDMAYFYNSSYNNAYHYIKIYNGPSTSSPLLGTYYSTNNPGTHISTHSTGALTVYMYETGYSSGSDVGWVADVSLIGGNANTEQITWNTTGTSGTYDLSYSVNNGSSWKEIINSYTTNLGTYDWLVPNDPTTQALIRVEDAGNSSIVDESDSLFTIEQADPRLEEPNGGEKFSAGNTTTIEWDEGYFVATVVLLEYSIDSGSTWTTITTGTTNDGSYLWTIPTGISSTNALVRVSEFNNTSIFDVSDAVFEITDFIALTSPATGTSFNGCQNVSIAWCSGAVSGTYTAQYSLDNGGTWQSVSTGFTSSGNSHTLAWTIPNDSTSQLLVRVFDTNDPTKTDQVGPMSIAQSQYLSLTYPNGGQSFVAGTAENLTWIASGPVSTVRLQYSLNSGSNWYNVVTSTSGGTYAWNIPNTASTGGRIRVMATNNTCIYDESDADFAFVSEVAVTQANGGEVWKAVVPKLDNNSADIRISDGTTTYVHDGYRFYDSGGTSSYTLANNASHTNTLYPGVDGAKVSVDFNAFDLAYFYNSSYNNAYHYLKVFNGPSTSSPLLGTYYSTNNPGTLTSTHSTGALTFYMYETGYSSGSDVGWDADISLIGGNTYDTEQITWTTTGTSGNFDLAYSVDNGGNWKQIINDYSTNTGVYEWLVPNDPTIQALVRVEDAGNGNIVDQSDAVFTIEQADPKLFTPNGGEEWFSKSTYNITWHAGLFVESALNVDYSPDGGTSWVSIANGTPNDGSYTWTIPDFTEEYDNALIRVSEYNSGISDVSDAVLSLSPAVQVYAPNGGGGNVELRGCTETTIIWKAGGTTNSYKLEYSENDGSSWTTIESSYYSTALVTNYDWTIPNLYSDDFLVRVSDAGDASKYDQSDTTYAIRPPITIINPNLSGDLKIGTTYTISWESDGASGFYDLSYSNDGGSSWNNIALNQNLVNDEYDWTIPNDPSNQVLVRVVDNIDNCKQDISDNLLEITPNTSAITIESPNGGETWVSCGDSLITWTSTGVSGLYDIEYSDDGGTTWNTIVTNYNTSNDEYLWSLPALDNETMAIRVTDATDPTKTDLSDGTFTFDPVVVAEITPDGPTTFCAGEGVTLTSSSAAGNLWSPGGQTTQSIYVTAAGDYTVQVSSGSCNALSDITSITVNAIPATPTISGDTLVAIGDTIELNASTIANAVYSWSGPDSYTSSDQNPQILSAQYNNSGTYYVGVEVSGCPSFLNSMNVSVGNAATVSGVVQSEVGSLVNGAAVSVSGYAQQNAVTGVTGQYEFFLENGQNYQIAASKNNDVITNNGISTLDLILMQRHILNLDSLDSPYKIIAADVDKSNSVTTLDIVLAQSVILQNTTTFPNGQLWSFVSSDYTFTNQQNPFPYTAERSYTGVATAANQHFIGMKLGDVNNSWDPAVAKAPATGAVYVSLDAARAGAEGTLVIPVRVEAFDALSGYQFTTSWDAEALEFVDVVNQRLEGNFGATDLANGKLTTSWHTNGMEGVTLDDGTVLFELVFRSVEAASGETEVRITSDRTVAEAYTESLELLTIESNSSKVQLGAPAAVNATGFEVFPNPFVDAVTIRFDADANGSAKLELVNALGQVLVARPIAVNEGANTLDWNPQHGLPSELSPGMYWISLQVGEVEYRKQVVKL